MTLRAAHRCMARRLTICILVTPVLPTPHRALAEISLCSPLHFQIVTANRADTVLWTFASGFFPDPTARHGVSPLRAQKRTYQLFTRAGSARETLGLSPALVELILDALEAAVEMIDPADSGFSDTEARTSDMAPSCPAVPRIVGLWCPMPEKFLIKHRYGGLFSPGGDTDTGGRGLSSSSVLSCSI